MKKIIILVLYVSIFNLLIGQEEYEIHLKSIDSTFLPCRNVDDDSIYNGNRALVDYIIKNCLSEEEHINYISNRSLLHKLEKTKCDSNSILIIDTLITGELCEVYLEINKFSSGNHVITQTSNGDKLIDNQIPFGALYTDPINSISKFWIKINGQKIKLPKKAYANLYNLNICDYYRSFREIEVFNSIDGKHIYVYIYGGNNGGVYLSKLIFNKEKYITKIVADYFPLSSFGGFSKKSIGF